MNNEQILGASECDMFASKYHKKPPPLSTRSRPYNFDFGSVYRLTILHGSRFIVRGKGKPNLAMLKRWKKIIDTANDAIRIKICLPNGNWWGAFCASQPDVWLVASIQYLEGIETIKKASVGKH